MSDVGDSIIGLNKIPEMETEQAAAGGVGAILDRGWRLGKKIAIAGVAISSAPIVLPPLALVSALGIALAVPFGLVFAGYACTDRIMRSLLATPGGNVLSEKIKDVAEGLEEEQQKADDVAGMEDEMEALMQTGEDAPGEIAAEDDRSRLHVAAAEEDREKMEEEESKYNLEKIVEEKMEKTEEIDKTASDREIQKIEEEEKRGENVTEAIGDERRLEVAAAEDDERNVEDKELECKEEEILVEEKQKAEEVDETEEGKESGQNDEMEKGEENLREITKADESGVDVGGAELDKERYEDEGSEHKTEPKTKEEQKADIHGENEDGKKIQGNEQEKKIAEEEVLRDIAEENKISVEDVELESKNEVIPVEEKQKAEEVETEEDKETKQSEEGEKGDENVREIIESEESRVDVSAAKEGEEKNKDEGLKYKTEPKTEEEEPKKTNVHDENEKEKEKAEEEVLSGFEIREVKGDEVQEGEENVREVTEDNGSRLEVKQKKPGEVKEGEENVREITEGDRSGFATGEMKGDEVQLGAESVRDAKDEERESDVVEIGGHKEVHEEQDVKEIAIDDEDGVPSAATIGTVKEDNGVPGQVILAVDKIYEDTEPMAATDSVHPLGDGVESVSSGLSSKDASVTKEKSEHGVSTEMADSIKQLEPIAEVTSDTPPEEDLYTEEKVWEQIKAIRMIVGYNAALHTSYIEELNSLYLFTGVEPPATLKDTCNLIEVNDNLQFLKSIVGVK